MNSTSKNILRPLAALALTLAAALAQGNDECTGAVTVVDGANGPFTNTAATTSVPAWPCGNGGRDLWFTYTATCTGSLVVDTCGATTYDSTLEIFSGDCANLTSLGCNDDACALQSRLTLQVVTGQVLWLRVGGFNSLTGTFVLNLSCAGSGGGGPGDECATAAPVTLGNNGPFSNAGLTTSSPWPCGAGGIDRWFLFVPTRTAPYTFRTCSGTRSFDTVLEVFSGACGNQTSLGCNDDSCGVGSEVVATLTGGTTYYVRVGGFNNAVGSFDLEVVLGTGQGTISRVSQANCGPTGFDVTGNPVIGGSVTMTLRNVLGIPFIGLGFTSPNNVICGCTFGSDWSLTTFGMTTGVSIPNDPIHLGATFYTQGVDLYGLGGCASPQFAATDSYMVQIG